MKKILILTASYGEGHNAAAHGLRGAFERLGGGEAEVFDPFPEAYGDFYNRSRSSYLELIDRAPRVWAAFYEILDRTPLIHLAIQTLGKVESVLARVISERRPDAIISTYPIYNYLLQRLHPRSRPRSFAQYTIVTDSITINSVWYRCESDLFFVPNEETARVMITAGVPREKLADFGFPVPPVFAVSRPERPQPDRDHCARVLYMINGARRRAPAMVAQLLRCDRIELTVTVGRDEALREELETLGAREGKKITVLGWIPDMPQLLMSHHLLIGKAGGAAVQETIAARTPMVITNVVPGQEEGNARLLVENGCGIIAQTPEAIAQTLDDLFCGNSGTWREWEGNITRLSRPDAGLKIAEAVLQRIE